MESSGVDSPFKKGKMNKTKISKMEELDSKIEKINYDLLALESRKKEIEDKKVIKQQEIEKQEEEKKAILIKTDKMTKLQKIIYFAFCLRNDLKQIDLLNVRIEENRKERDDFQKKIDIQNNLYEETIKEKDKYIEERRNLYVENINQLQKQEENKNIEMVTKHTQDLNQIHEIAKKYKQSAIMGKIAQIIEENANKVFKKKENTREIINKKVAEEQDEME